MLLQSSRANPLCEAFVCMKASLLMHLCSVEAVTWIKQGSHVLKIMEQGAAGCWSSFWGPAYSPLPVSMAKGALAEDQDPSRSC